MGWRNAGLSGTLDEATCDLATARQTARNHNDATDGRGTPGPQSGPAACFLPFGAGSRAAERLGGRVSAAEGSAGMPVLGWWRRTRRWWLERNTHGRPTQDKVFVRPAFGRSDSAGAHDAGALSRTSSTGSNDSKQGVFAGSSFAQGEVWERARRRGALQHQSGAVTERTERGHRLAHNDSFARSPGAERSREAKLESLHELLRATSVESVTSDTSASRLTRGRGNLRRVESDPQFRQESLHAEPVAS